MNNDKTKVMILSTPKMSRVHHLNEYDPNIAVSGVHINEHLKWDYHIKNTVSGCYATLSILRKLKYLAKYELIKQLAETLILSKLDHADLDFFTTILTSPFAASSVCCHKFCTLSLC